MSNYIIFKGIDSRNINGLLICELPPITKPTMRTEIIEVDGRDGDILIEKGYSGYDQSLKIGLTKNFDINEIIKFFSGSGEMILSNEPDKIHQVSINEQVVYERLVRFKTANINIHFQPYKYLLNEEIVELTITNQNQIEVDNVGLEISKPIITLYGSGKVEIFINEVKSFEINIDDEYVVVNSLEEDAYKDNVLKNNNMNGEFPILKVGKNIISWTGNLTKIKIEPKSRWL